MSCASSPRSISTHCTRPVNRAVAGAQLVADRRSAVRAHVGGLVGREEHRHGGVDTALPDLRPVDVERRGPALAQAAAVVGELHPHLTLAGRHDRVALDLELPQAEEVVAVDGPAVLEIQAPAAEGAALGDDHPFGAAVGHDDLRRHGVRLVLHHHHRVLRQPPHPAEQHLAGAADELRAPGEVRVEALDAAVVEWQDVVLRRLDQEQPLQLAQASRAARPRGRAPVSSRPGRRAPTRRPRGAGVSAISHGVLWRVTAVQPLW